MIFQVFSLCSICYLIWLLSGKIDSVGLNIAKHLNMPDEVAASTFQALATSGPEILIAILAATSFIANTSWQSLTLSERACSGTLNMAFSAMDNLLGIGAVAIIFSMLFRGLDPKEIVPSNKNTIISLSFYTLISGLFALFCFDCVLTNFESICLMIVGLLFVFIECLLPMIERHKLTDKTGEEGYGTLNKRFVSLFCFSFEYIFLIFGMIVFVQVAIKATFNIAVISSFSVGGIIMLFTSYISSFPELVLSFRYAMENRRNEMLGMLFGSNIIDLSFAGFRSIWLNEKMAVISTGTYGYLLKWYLAFIPIISLFLLVGIMTKKLKWCHFYLLSLFYLIYIVTGFIYL